MTGEATQVVRVNAAPATAPTPSNAGRRRRTGTLVPGLVVCAAIGVMWMCWRRSPDAGSNDDLAFLNLDDKDGRYCGQEGDICKCFGRVRYGRFFSWSEDVMVDGSINCSSVAFNAGMPMSNMKICKCFPTICTTDTGICTPEPCECPRAGASFEYVKKQLVTSEGTKCWACEKRPASTGSLVNESSEFCPSQIGRCTLNRGCKCEDPVALKRMMKTKEGKRCWTCAPNTEASSGMGSESRAMFWMLPMLWPFMDFPNSLFQVFYGNRALSTFLLLCLVGFFCQTCLPFLGLDRWFSFFAPCMKKLEFWRLFSYFMLHSDLQHLLINFLHILDALDIEGVPEMEVSPGVPLRCTRDGPVTHICYPDIGMGLDHTITLIALVLAFGALVGTLKSFGALVQGASSVCFGLDGALIALYAMFLGAGLDSQLKIQQFGAFFWMRIGILAFHIILDMLQSICGGGRETVGTIAHMASLVAGFCYVIIALPPMGDGSLFRTPQPYIIDCGLTSPWYVTTDGATKSCIAFFSRGNGIEVEQAQTIAKTIVIGGVFLSVVNMFLKRHISDDGIACPCFSCLDSQPVRADELQQQLATLKKEQDKARQEVQNLERLCESFDKGRALVSNLQVPQGGGDGGGATAAAAQGPA